MAVEVLYGVFDRDDMRPLGLIDGVDQRSQRRRLS